MSGRGEGVAAIGDLLRCPVCRTPLRGGDDRMECPGCRGVYPVAHVGGAEVVCLLAPQLSSTKQEIQAFWGDTCRQWYETHDLELTSASLRAELDLVEDFLRRRRHLAVTEVDLASLRDVRLCEIGSGGGAHSALFRKHGAHVVALDVTEERVWSTARKLGLLSDVPWGSGTAIQGDAENVPLADESFEIVYSNGVLHHSEDTEAAVREVHRLLVPGGRAIVMLYARPSANYWLRLLPTGIVRGLVFRLPEAEWLGRITEGRPKHGANRNPITRVYSEAGIRRLFSAFGRIELRRYSFNIAHVPLPYAEHVRTLLLRALGGKPHEGGRLLYGRPFVPEMAFELALGRSLGFGWNITAWK
jgi:SAM-dependent methyltransferase